MGLSSEVLTYIYENTRDTICGLLGKRMFELGSQEVMGAEGIIPERTGKEYYKNRV